MGAGTQIAVTYQPEEDRLLLRYPADGQEVRMWITRRMAGRWLGAVGQVFDRVHGTSAQPAESRRAVSAFKRESAVEGADFARPYEAPAELPPWPADGPLLVTRISMTPAANGSGVAVTFADRAEETLSLSLDQRELHAVVHMLTMAVEKAGWALPEARAAKAPGTRGAAPRRAN